MDFGCCESVSACSEAMCWFSDARSCLMTYVNSEISTGLSSKSVFRFATGTRLESASDTALPQLRYSRSANLRSFAVVAVIPRPISAARRANSDLVLLPFSALSKEPFACRLWESDNNACRCDPTFEDAARFWACPRMAWNSPVRSCIDGPVISQFVERTVK